ncbi:MAG: hypothetical protein LBB67_07425, partial [Oscillospiraceae bacterium]|nr:hypothetical protein [Oscillospiraceae bacterium]
HPAGSAYENGDVNIPSPEALLRNLLLGNGYFQRTFGVRCKDIFLPDCFGFGTVLPSVAAHSNLLGFATTKLMQDTHARPPFAYGRWRGVDGKEIFAVPDAHDYNTSLKKAREHFVLRRNLRVCERRGIFPAAYTLHGVGDQGGAPKEESVRTVCGEIQANSAERVQVRSAASDRIFRDLSELPAAEQKALPVYCGEWLMTDHGVGCYTARTWSKRWNRQAEQLADRAERVSCFAAFLGRTHYPAEALNAAWKRVIAHQFHDDITGTSNEISYARNWNDLYIAQLQFAEAERAAASFISHTLDTGFAVGRCVLVSNPTQWVRNETAEIRLPFPLQGSYVRVTDKNGHAVPSQLDAAKSKARFAVSIPPMSVVLYDVQINDSPFARDTGLRVAPGCIENKHLRALIDGNGDIASLFDKRTGAETLKAPVRLALFDFDGSEPWPMWELGYKEIKRRPKEYPQNPRIRVIDDGAAYAAIEIVREARSSVFRQVISLDADGTYLRVHNDFDWHALRTLAKIEFVTTASNPMAAYDTGFGIVTRRNSSKRLYEVPAQQWADITDKSGAFGLTILSDSRAGWDKPNGNTLRLTAVYTPKSGSRGAAHVLDFGRTRFDFGLFPHAGSWRNGASEAGVCFGQPLATFFAPDSSNKPCACRNRRHTFGAVGGDFIIRCVKRAENAATNDPIYIVRLQESSGKSVPDAFLTFGNGIVSFEEVYASEEPRAIRNRALLADGTLRFSLDASEIRSFALRIAPMGGFSPPKQTQIDLPWNIRLTRAQGEAVGQSSLPIALPQEQLPSAIKLSGVQYALRPKTQKNAVVCKAQQIVLPAGRELRLLLTSFAADNRAAFLLGGKPIEAIVHAAFEPVGMGDLPDLGLSGFTKETAVPVFVFQHTHIPKDGVWQDAIGKQALLFEVRLPLSGKPETLQLPNASSIALFAAVVTSEPSAKWGACCADHLDLRTEAQTKPNLTEDQLKTALTPNQLRKSLQRIPFLLAYARRRIALWLKPCGD